MLAALTWRFVEEPVRRLRPGPFSTRGGAVRAGVGLLAVCAELGAQILINYRDEDFAEVCKGQGDKPAA